MLSESGGLSLHLCVCARVHVCAFNHVLWLEARPKISGSTIVTLMQSGTVATTGPAVKSKEPSICFLSISVSSEDSYSTTHK